MADRYVSVFLEDVMMKIDKLIDPELLDSMLESKCIVSRRHPSLPLTIFNYTDKAAYGRIWNVATRLCRGLIVSDDKDVIARPFSKFFNVEEHAVDNSLGLPQLPLEKFSTTEKLDGSLIIGCSYEGGTVVASRGSFQSEMAIHAQGLIKREYGNFVFPSDETWCFEIIYPENRIVIDYGDKDELILLGVVETETGYDLPLPEETPFRRVISYGFDSVDEVLSMRLKDIEGFVLRFESGLRVKVKTDQYKLLHKLIWQTTTKYIWELLRSKKSVDEFLSSMPEDLRQWICIHIARFREKFIVVEVAARDVAKRATGLGIEDPMRTGRKEIARFVTVNEYPYIVFKMLDGKDYVDDIWKLLKPDLAESFRQSSKE